MPRHYFTPNEVAGIAGGCAALNCAMVMLAAQSQREPPGTRRDELNARLAEMYKDYCTLRELLALPPQTFRESLQEFARADARTRAS